MAIRKNVLNISKFAEIFPDDFHKPQAAIFYHYIFNLSASEMKSTDKAAKALFQDSYK